MKEVGQVEVERMASNAGIAIGPILFIIAILAILAAAIAAGSGGFTASTATESSRTKASALIQIGENLKVGMDRVTMENGIALSSVVINPANTSDTNDLFSPTGGGISVPSAALANQPGTDTWLYPQASLPGLGTSAPDQLAVLSIDQGTCTEVNSKALATATPPAADLGNFMETTIPNSESSQWPLSGQTVGCVQNNNPSTPGYFFFQVLYIQ